MECPYKKIKLESANGNAGKEELHESMETDGGDPEQENLNDAIEDPSDSQNNPRELMILDELNDDVDGEQEDGDSDSSGSEINFDEDIENLLDERLPEELKHKKKNQQYEERFKTVMEGNLSISTFSWYSHSSIAFRKRDKPL
jgi:hypothetical protein